MNRIAFIDFLKGFSIIGVLIIHLSSFLSTQDEHFIPMYFTEHLFRFAVPIFIASLGYMTISKYIKNEKWGTFYFNKFWTILLPFIIWSVIYFPTKSVFPYQPKADLTILNFLLGNAEIHLYFIVAYISFIIITPFIVSVMQYLTKKQIAVISMNFVTLHLIFLFILKYTPFEFLDTLNEFMHSRLPHHWLAYYATGIIFALTAEQITKFAKNKEKVLPIGFFGFLIIQIIIVTMHVVESENFIYDTPELFLLFLNSIGLLYSLYLMLKENKIKKFFCYLGENSFPIFLSHILWYKLSFIYIFNEEVSYLNLLYILLIGLALSILYIPIHKIIFNKTFNYFNKTKKQR